MINKNYPNKITKKERRGAVWISQEEIARAVKGKNYLIFIFVAIGMNMKMKMKKQKIKSLLIVTYFN